MDNIPKTNHSAVLVALKNRLSSDDAECCLRQDESAPPRQFAVLMKKGGGRAPHSTVMRFQ